MATSLARDQGHHEGHRDVVDGDAGGDGDISRSGVWGVARPENSQDRCDQLSKVKSKQINIRRRTQNANLKSYHQRKFNL